MSSREEWNVIQVINSVGLTGSVPLDRKEEARGLLHALLSDCANSNMKLDKYRKAYNSAVNMHYQVSDAMKDNNLLRARTLIVDWNLEHKL